MSFSFAPGGLLLQDLGVQARGQLALSVSFAARSQFTLLNGLAQGR